MRSPCARNASQPSIVLTSSPTVVAISMPVFYVLFCVICYEAAAAAGGRACSPATLSHAVTVQSTRVDTPSERAPS